MELLKKSYAYIAWTTALLATLGSLYFSNVLHYPPCILCWYQRIMMYPLILILGIGILIKDARVYLYALPLALIGMGISIYHNLLYYKIVPESAAPCIAGVSCTTKYINYFGFITIPLLSLAAFFIIILCLIFYKKQYENS